MAERPEREEAMGDDRHVKELRQSPDRFRAKKSLRLGDEDDRHDGIGKQEERARIVCHQAAER